MPFLRTAANKNVKVVDLSTRASRPYSINMLAYLYHTVLWGASEVLRLSDRPYMFLHRLANGQQHIKCQLKRAADAILYTDPPPLEDQQAAGISHGCFLERWDIITGAWCPSYLASHRQRRLPVSLTPAVHAGLGAARP